MAVAAVYHAATAVGQHGHRGRGTAPKTERRDDEDFHGEGRVPATTGRCIAPQPSQPSQPPTWARASLRVEDGRIPTTVTSMAEGACR